MNKNVVEFDSGLSKNGLREVQEMVNGARGGFEVAITDIKRDFDRRFDDMEKRYDHRENRSAEFRSKMYNAIDEINRSIAGLEFKHNWKTAMWVFIGSACPTTIGIVFFIFKR